MSPQSAMTEPTARESAAENPRAPQVLVAPWWEASRQTRRGLRQRLIGFARLLLTFYWGACLAVLVAGLQHIYPYQWDAVMRPIQTAAKALVLPFPSCAAAKQAGYSNMALGTAGYAPWLDRDRDGLACEPIPE
jgi:hypothetical protein